MFCVFFCLVAILHTIYLMVVYCHYTSCLFTVPFFVFSQQEILYCVILSSMMEEGKIFKGKFFFIGIIKMLLLSLISFVVFPFFPLYKNFSIQTSLLCLLINEIPLGNSPSPFPFFGSL